MIHRHWPNTLAAAQGHLQRQRQEIRSTHPMPEPPSQTSTPLASDFDNSAPDTSLHFRCFNRADAVFADATGRFPEPPRQGSEYMIVFAYKNYIHVECTRTRSAVSYVQAFTAALEFFRTRGHHIAEVVIDNETSADLKQLFADRHIEVQTVPPGDKRANKAERCIQT